MIAAISVTASVHALMLALALLRRALPRRAWAAIYAGLFLALASAVVPVIAFDHAALGNPRMWRTAEAGLTLAAGPVFLLFVCRLLGRRGWVGPMLAATAVFGVIAAASGLPPGALLSAERLILLQQSCTAVCAWLVWTSQPASRGARRARGAAGVATVAMLIVHAAQVLRLAWPQVQALRDVVPLAGAAVFLVLSAAVFFAGRLTLLDPLVDAPGVHSDRAAACPARLDAMLSAGGLRDRSLTVRRAAAHLGMPVAELSARLRQDTGMGFAEFLAARRVDAACQLLADPSEARTSVEAVGLLVGFGARSTFYAAFARRHGVSPAQYRALALRRPVRKPESGQ